ncbi:hypothetical protein LYNGBM3L_67030 [Moorena producens 3L]|uniref:Uncharacterized protein n=1 Tax=Moorena producens 3L TaxID=489825 RepID=F4Y1W1_9CYAN|nr:hypothetical protein LYNGBM3L_67030 [Moorena producens 3L]OLT64466.1 hypothetical protein BI334_05000 [Moorena producens 3L]
MVVLSDCSIEHWYYQLLSFVQSIVRFWRVVSVLSVGRWGETGDGEKPEMGRNRRWGETGDGES